MMFKHEALCRRLTTTIFRQLLFAYVGSKTLSEAKSAIVANAPAVVGDLQTLEWLLGRQPFIAGDRFTIADYMFVCELSQFAVMGRHDGFLPDSVRISLSFPNIAAYLARVDKADPLCAQHLVEVEELVAAAVAS